MRNRISIVAFVTFIGFYATGEAQIGCGFQPDAAWQARVAAFKKTDTLRVLAIWAVADSASNKKLPTFWREMWDSNQLISLPRFYAENSDRKYILNADPLGAPDSFCISPILDPVGFTGGRNFTREVLFLADPHVNFADYDRDGDKFIEDGIVICIAYDTAHLGAPILGLTGGGALDTFVTNDLVGGIPIKIVAGSGVTIRVPTREQGVQLAAHEWGHLFGLRDYFAKTTSDWWSSGSFTAMGYIGFNYRASPFSPFQNHKFIGWNQPVDVNATSYSQQIGNYMSSKQFYRLKRDSTEYFEASFHSQGQANSSRWEEMWPGQGVVIAHIVDTVASPQSKAVKQYDLELPHGLYDTTGGVLNFSNPNDSLGGDSLDLFLPYWNKNLATHEAGSQTCLWNSNTKRYFDDRTNPSARAYQNVSETYMQRTPSKIAIEDIKITGPNASADFVLNAQYGDITSNTTLGPGLVPVIGTINVKPGATLTLSAGAVLKAQKKYNNESPEDTNSRIRIVVDTGGKLVIAGTAGNPVKLISSDSLTSGLNDWRGIVVKPGGYLSVNNAIIRNAYIGIEDESRLNHTIQNVKIGRCLTFGIQANYTDSLTIRGCRVDSVNNNPGGTGIRVVADTLGRGAKLIADTARYCYYGFSIFGSTAPVDSCFILGDTTAALFSYVGIDNREQYCNPDTLGTCPVTISNTSVIGFFYLANFGNFNSGEAFISNCFFSGNLSMFISPVAIRNTGFGHYLKVRGTTIYDWGAYAVFIGKREPIGNQIIDLGVVPSDNGNNAFYTSVGSSNWKFVYDEDCETSCLDTIKAEKNQWYGVPSSNRFSSNVDYIPYNTPLPPPSKVIAEGETEKETRPRTTMLFQNYPNPFNPTTLIQFNLERPERVNLEIFNILGQKVRTLLSGEEFAAGPYKFLWDGKDDRGSSVSSGLYVYRLQTPTYLQTKKMMLVK